MDYTAKEGLMILVRDFRDRQQKFEYLNDYDAAMQNARERNLEKSAGLQEPLKSIAQKIFDICDQTHFFFHVLHWKIDYLAEGLEHALKVENPMSLANNARSLVEHIATFSTVGQRIAKLESDLEGQQSENKIVEALNGAQAYLRRAYYGRSPKLCSDGDDAAIHVNDSLRDLKKDIPNIDEIYDFLCEFVHPNYGSNQLISSGDLASGQLKPSEEFNREILDKLRGACSLSFIYLRENIRNHLLAPARLQGTLDLCFVRGAKLNNVFGKKSPKPVGDGKSKETAYFFPKARTAMEAIKLTYEFFASEGFERTGMKRIGSVEESFIYDVHETNKGDIWVKIPMSKV
ncbi:MAG: hypothetical protein R3F19_16505 [Verrucomicrobiales bacterium]